MGRENLKDSMDKTMSALRDSLKQARENLGRATENLNSRKEQAAPQEAPDTQIPAAEEPAAEASSRNAPPPSPARMPESLARQLKQLSSKLDIMVSGTEDEFLHIGGRLNDFHQRAHKISEMSEYVARLINDKEVEKAVTDLNWILDMLKTWLAGLSSDEGISNRRHRAEKVVERTESCLSSLTDKHCRAANLVRVFSSRSENVSRYIAEVILSLQYHDITRQRIDHVRSELDSLTACMEDAHGKPLAKDLAASTGAICRDLARVLMTAREEFGHATQSIIENLDMVASNAFAISEEIRSSTKGESDGEKSFLSGMGNWLSALADIIETFSGDVNKVAGVDFRTTQADPAALELNSRAELLRLVDTLNGMVKSMHRVNGNILYHLSLIDDSGKSLSEDIGSEISMFDVHERLTASVEDVTAGLLSIVEMLATGNPPCVSDLHNSSVDNCAARIRTADAQGKSIELF